MIVNLQVVNTFFFFSLASLNGGEDGLARMYCALGSGYLSHVTFDIFQLYVCKINNNNNKPNYIVKTKFVKKKKKSQFYWFTTCGRPKITKSVVMYSSGILFFV